MRFLKLFRVWYIINAMSAPGVTAQEATESESSSLDGAMGRNGIMAKYGTTGLEAAMRPQYGRNQHLVGPDHDHQQLGQHGREFLRKTQFSASARSMP